MNKQKLTSKKSFFKWIHKNRVKIGIWLFLVALPLGLVVTAYVGSYTSNRSLYFETEITEESVKIKDFVAHDDLKAIELNIEWDALKKPLKGDDGELDGGYYRFVMSYTPNTNYSVSSVKVTPVLKTDWKDMKSIGIQRPLSYNNTSFSVDFNFDLPKSPLLFVTIVDPNLYLKVEYVYKTAGQDVTEIEYVKFSLKDLNPKTVIPD